jgi:D-beta-D-heptose 7-phosphate kinase/D-beta-D-heptose 1-phosphate adenosyltransferase
VLIVGVNSDRSVRGLKGAGRPVNGQDDRAAVLSALSCVDHVVIFDEDDPRALVRLLRPHVFAKGGDYTRETLPEAATVEEFGGVVRILPYYPSCSTTDLIERLARGPKSSALVNEPA